MIINPVKFTNKYHNNVKNSKNASGKQINSSKGSDKLEKQIFTNVVKESINSIIGDKWYLNMEIAMTNKPIAWKQKNSPKMKEPV